MKQTTRKRAIALLAEFMEAATPRAERKAEAADPADLLAVVDLLSSIDCLTLHDAASLQPQHRAALNQVLVALYASIRQTAFRIEAKDLEGSDSGRLAAPMLSLVRRAAASGTLPLPIRPA